MYEPNDTEKNLEDLLEELFMQDDDNIAILRRPTVPSLLGNCCTSSYGSYAY